MIALKEIDHRNWQECIKLKVKKEQEHFVPSNLYSLVQAKYQNTEYYSFVPFASYLDETMVGFIMWDDVPNNGVYVIPRLMIDEQYQGKGIAKRVLQTAIDIIKQKKDCKGIQVSYEPDNVAAQRLYASLGFKRNELKSKTDGPVVELKIK
ncbi:GNAT family N-acetyltransferase [Paenibacillus oceani]|uniref:GNAT family N-acetyltransferase n=1 Tax=Paenibacillus oceani TaxID=2772510 RepID=A0A927CDK3_9BACL|nr:GNAT family N-acetyltransferase [Paenibacillus oceani]MBD2863981.1 GNAT family N-acetyltransferase [Paenibacillus oceani]